MDSVFLWPALTPLFPTPTAHWKAGHTVLSQPHTCFFISLLLHLWTYCSYVFSHSIMSDSLQPFWTVSHQAPVSMGFFRQECWKKKKNVGVGWHFLLQGIFPTHGSNLCLLRLLHCRQILYPLSHWGSPWTFYSGAMKQASSVTITSPTSSSPLALRLSYLGLLAWSSGVLVYFLFYFASL